ncbi:MAG: zinc metalloprotease HtpX [Candidatus Micrarchaeota archaeon]
MALLYDEIKWNKRKSVAIVFFFILFVLFTCFIFAEVLGFFYGESGLGFILFPAIMVVAILSSVFSYYYSDRMVLSISGARPAEKSEFPHLYNTVEGLSIAAGIPMPKVYVIEDPAPNAFATGRDPRHSAIAVTTGLLNIMGRYELEGVIGHEMAHIKNYDIRLATFAVVMVGFVALLSNLMLRMGFMGGFRGGGGGNRKGGGAVAIVFVLSLVLAVLAPVFAQMVRLAISRNREYLADASGALLTRYPDGLASALEKIAKDNHKLQGATDATAPLYISNPLKGKLISGLFATHPPIEERVKRLRSM